MKPRRRILIVEDEQPTIDSLELLLSDTHQISVAQNGEDALRSIKSESMDLVFLDISLPGLDGFETLKEIKKYDESIDVIMLTADDRARTAVRAMELGAFHYITKPYDKDDILLIVRRVFEKKKMAEEIISLRDDLQNLDPFHSMVGQDPKMREVYSLIRKVAAVDSTVLITGESGTGKELVARAIHSQSVRKDKHFKAINCGAIPENLLESELFGHEKGAFTGAVERKIGKFEMAHEGTLFLDEISAMQEILQVKLLRVLQDQELERVGGLKSIPIDVRIISASNANMKKIVERGQFREDLFYRLDVIHIVLPPLRERRGDILLLADYYLKLYATKFGKQIDGFSESARQAMEEYAWPGNVRELKNVIERAVVLSDRPRLSKESLPLNLAVPSADLGEPGDDFSLKDVLEAYEKKVILNILERAQWNQTRAAEILGIHRNTLLLKLDSLGIRVKQLKQENENKVLAG